MSYADAVPPETNRHNCMAIKTTILSTLESISITYWRIKTQTPHLDLAISKHYHHTLQRLLKNKQAITDENICLAIKSKNTYAVEQLLQNIQNNTTLTPSYAYHEAVKHLQSNTLTMLANTRLDPNTQNENGISACHLALNMNIPQLLRQLLSHTKINTNSQDHYGDTPCHWAVRNNNIAGLKALLKHPTTDPNACNHQGLTPAHQAILDQREECLELLLKHTAININAIDMEKRSLCHIAVQNNQKNCLKQLILHPMINLNQTDQDSLTPFHWAMLKKNEPMLRLLRKHIQVERYSNSSKHWHSIINKKSEAAG